MARMEENKKTMKKKDRAKEAGTPERPVFDQQKFLEILNTLVERAKKKKNMLEYQEISDAFQSMCLSVEQLENVLEYLEIHNVDVLRISDDDDDADLLIEDDDVEVENIDLTVPDGVSIGKNTAISGVTEKDDYPNGALAGGEYVIKAGGIL